MNETGEELPEDGRAEPVLLGCEAENVCCVQGLRAPSRAGPMTQWGAVMHTTEQ